MRMPVLLALGLMTSFLVIPTTPSESKLYFDADLKFNPPTDVRLHYAQFSQLQGSEVEFSNFQEVGGQILSIFDETVVSNAGGVIEFDVEFQTYDPVTTVSFQTPPEPQNPFFGGGGGPGGGFEQPAPGDGGTNAGLVAPQLQSLPSISATPLQPQVTAPSGQRVPTVAEVMPAVNEYWRRSQQRQAGNFGPGYRTGGSYLPPGAMGVASPMQRGGGGEGGEGGEGGGGFTGPTAGAEEEDEFEVAPILETELNYSIAQNGRLLNFTGLDIIGDIINPRRNITVRQFWQTSHFLTLPDGPIHVGESWKGPWFWSVPFIGETIEIPLTYSLVGIETYERFRCAVISFSGIKQFEMTTLDENSERRVESDIQGDITVNSGYFLFDIDRGIVIAMAPDLTAKRASVLSGSFPIASNNNWGLVTFMTFDRLDTVTPLGNVLDPEPVETHKLQELIWVNTMVME